MSTTAYEYTIHIDGRTMTPAQLFEFARGLVEAERPIAYAILEREFILAHRQIRKLQRKLRKAAGREKRMIQERNK